MKVKRMIELLQDEDPDAEFLISTGDEYCHEPTEPCEIRGSNDPLLWEDGKTPDSNVVIEMRDLRLKTPVWAFGGKTLAVRGEVQDGKKA